MSTRRRLLFPLALFLLLFSCSERRVRDSLLSRVTTWGKQGTEPGNFSLPRPLAVDRHGFVYVIDKAGRVQKFTLDGRLVTGWRMPLIEKGKPTGCAVAPNGDLIVADTHYHQVMRYDPQGNLLAQWGSYGTEPGQFIYPNGVAVDAEGSIYVSEYGGNDRIQKFDSQGHLIAFAGRPGDKPGEFSRPEGLAIDKDGNLLVADAVNHRIERLSPDLKPLAVWGEPGSELGKLRYPYGVAVSREGYVLVSEYGNNRVSVFTPNGQFLAAYGRAGSGGLEFGSPWGIGVDGEDNVYVADYLNHRVQKFPFILPVTGAQVR